MMTPVMTPEDDSRNSSEDELFNDDETDNDQSKTASAKEVDCATEIALP